MTTPEASRARRLWSGLAGPSWVFDPVGAGVRLPAVAVCLVVGLLSGHPLGGCLAAGGAFTCGFGAPLSLAGSRPLLLLAASVLISLAAITGSLAAHLLHGWPVALLIAAFGALCGWAVVRGPGPAWLSLQAALAAIIATSYPAAFVPALARAAVISLGGVVQALALMAASLARWRSLPPSPPDPVEPSHAWRLAVALLLAALVARFVSLRNGYWVPLTVLLVLRPDPQRTVTRLIARAAGTVVGALLASAIELFLRPSHDVLAALVVVAAFAAYLFQKATYGLFSAAVTLYVVFMLSFLGLPEPTVALARVLATVTGSVLAFLIVLAEKGLIGVRAKI